MASNSSGLTKQFDREEIIRTVSLLIAAGGITELRAIDANLRGDTRSGTLSGYFGSAELLADAVAKIANAKGIYIIPNVVDPNLLARAADRIRLVGKSEPTTSDQNIVRRHWLLIDFDAVRPSGISANNAEHDAAIECARQVRDYLRQQGWPEPIFADSGNGAHLNYRIDLPTDDSGLVQRCLTALHEKFTNDAVKIDTGVYNPARIWKLYGTLACKGDSTEDRPHRMSKLLEVPEKVEVVPETLLIALAATAVADSATSTKPNSSRSPDASATAGSIDLEAWIAKHLPEATGPKPWKDGGQIWTLPTCPFNPDHVGGSAWVGRLPNGPITAGCHHDSCQHWEWNDLRERFDPKALRIEDGNADHTADKTTQAEQLVRLAMELCRLGQTPKHEPFAVLKGGPNVAGRLGGSGGPLRDLLAREYRRRFKRTVSSSAFTDAFAALRGDAAEAPVEATHLRVGPYGDGFVLDLGTVDGAAVVVDATGWRVVARSPILFQRTALSGALPVPERGGRLDTLRDLLNVTDDTWPILLGWMVAAFIPEMPHPILLIGGLQGTGKTTAARMICGLIDPSDAPTRSQPRDPEAWAMMVANGWITVIDNISSIPEWLSDAMCKAVTGDGWVRRTLYTDGDVSVLSFRRVVGLTSIDAGALRGDLGERLVLVDLEVIRPEKRRTERALHKAYIAARPKVLGALLDLLVQVLAGLDKVDLPELPRMADFARVLKAMDQAIGTNALALYTHQGTRIAAEVVDADSVGEAVLMFMRSRAEWRGPAGKLLKEIRPEDAGKQWPKTPCGLASRLKRLAPALELQGVRVTPPDKNDRTRTYILQTTAQTAQPPNGGGTAASDGHSGRSGGLGGSAHQSNRTDGSGEETWTG